MSVAVRGCLKRSHPDAQRSEAGGVQRWHELAENSAGFPAFLVPAAGPNTATHSGTPDLRVVEAAGRPTEGNRYLEPHGRPAKGMKRMFHCCARTVRALVRDVGEKEKKKGLRGNMEKPKHHIRVRAKKSQPWS